MRASHLNWASAVGGMIRSREAVRMRVRAEEEGISDTAASVATHASGTASRFHGCAELLLFLMMVITYVSEYLSRVLAVRKYWHAGRRQT